MFRKTCGNAGSSDKSCEQQDAITFSLARLKAEILWRTMESGIDPTAFERVNRHQTSCPVQSHGGATEARISLSGDHLYCVHCGCSWDLLTLVMERDGCSHVDALRYLAEQCGVVWPDGDALST